MLKKLFMLLIVMCLNIQSFSQVIDLGYFPEYNGAVSKEKYNWGKEVLKNSYAQINGVNDVCYADYWNIAVAYASMGVDKQVVFDFLKKSKSSSKEDFCMIVNDHIEHKEIIENTRFYELLGGVYKEFVSDCHGFKNESSTIEEMMKMKESIDLNKCNDSLIDVLIVNIEKDQRYRYSTSVYDNNKTKQDSLDCVVQANMMKILDQFGYPGKDLVGEPFMNYASLMIEHGGSLDYQEKYLPMVAEACQKGQVDRTALRMLIDRVYWKKTGKQIFGSHVGIPFHANKVITKVKRKYNLE
ncbi:MAG: DUF6624 domain-containing protein [Salinivirgaceae bacterium]